MGALFDPTTLHTYIHTYTHAYVFRPGALFDPTTIVEPESQDEMDEDDLINGMLLHDLNATNSSNGTREEVIRACNSTCQEVCLSVGCMLSICLSVCVWCVCVSIETRICCMYLCECIHVHGVHSASTDIYICCMYLCDCIRVHGVHSAITDTQTHTTACFRPLRMHLMICNSLFDHLIIYNGSFDHLIIHIGCDDVCCAHNAHINTRVHNTCATQAHPSLSNCYSLDLFPAPHVGHFQTNYYYT